MDWNAFRVGTDNWKLYWNYLKENIEILNLDESDKDLLKTDIGLTGIYEDKEVLLDYLYIDNISEVNEEKDVELNSPKKRW